MMFEFPYVQPLCGSSAYRFYELSQGALPSGARARPLAGTSAGYWWVQTLPVERESWRSLLERYDDGFWKNNQDPNITEFEAMGHLLDKQILTIYEVPSPALMRELVPLSVFTKDERTCWRFTPCNAVEGKRAKVKSFSSTTQALIFLEPLALTDQHLKAIATLVNPTAPPSLTLRSLAHRLAHFESLSYSNLVVVEEHKAKSALSLFPQASATEHTYRAQMSPASLDLGPHEQSDSETQDAYPPVQSLDGGEQRRETIKNLSDEDRKKVDSVETFEPQGATREEALGYLKTEEGKVLLQSLRESDSKASDKVIVDRAIGQIRSGARPPEMVEVTSPLFKLVPKDGNVSPYSPFFTTERELNAAKQSGQPLSDYFGLPAVSDSEQYDIYRVEPKGGALGFVSEIAPTRELDGKLTTSGGGCQTIVPNRKQFTDPEKVGSMSEG